MRLPENAGVSSGGLVIPERFLLPERLARLFLSEPNAAGLPNSEVLVPWVSAQSLDSPPFQTWLLDFGVGVSEAEASRFERPYQYLLEEVREKGGARASLPPSGFWQLPGGHAGSLAGRPVRGRFLVTQKITDLRVFVWVPSPSACGQDLTFFLPDDDYFMGVLQSRIHAVWVDAHGGRPVASSLVRRYDPATCFEPFPFPAPLGQEEEGDPAVAAVADAARQLDGARRRWLAPPGWLSEEFLEFPGSTGGPWAHLVRSPDASGIGVVRLARWVPKDDAAASRMRGRTAARLYESRPAWLTFAHRDLDEAVACAYGWPADLPDAEILGRLTVLNHERDEV